MHESKLVSVASTHYEVGRKTLCCHSWLYVVYIYSPSIIHSFIGECKEEFMDSTGYGCLGNFARSTVETPNSEMDDNEE